MANNSLIIIILSVIFMTCQTNPSGSNDIHSKPSILDTLLAACDTLTLDRFDITQMQTDDFSKMVLLNKSYFKQLFPQETYDGDSLYFIHTRLVNKNAFILYQKNAECCEHRVDYIDLVHPKDQSFNKIRLAAIDNSLIQYEVVSVIQGDKLIVNTKVSSEPYFNPNRDTLYLYKEVYYLGDNNFTKIDSTMSFEERLN